MRDLQTARGAPLIDRPDESPTDPVGRGAADLAQRDGRLIGWLAVVAALVLAIDVATKLWVVEVLGRTQKVVLFGGHLVLRQTRNPGAAFGIATGATIVFSLVAVAVIVVIIRTSRRLRSLPWAVVLGLILGGATGNLVDRVLRSPGLLRGHVVDWINFGPDKFATFNAADSAIVAGGALAVLLAMRGIELDGSRIGRARPDGSGSGD